MAINAMDNRPYSIAPECYQVRALYDFRGQNNDELNLNEGDIITVTQTPEGGWFEGTLNGVTGWFPSNYVEPIDAGQEVIEVNHETSNHHPSAELTFDQCKEYRRMVINEIVESESSFLKELNTIHRQYLTQLLHTTNLPKHEVQGIIAAITHIISTHSQFLTSIHSLMERPSRTIRVGGVFMEFAARIKEVQSKYCSIHPKFVSTVDRHRDIVTQVLRPASPVSENNVVIHFNSSLSLPFRRLDKYPALLQELQRYTHEADPDRGDTQRAGHFFRELISHCLDIRRQKEMEVEVMLGNIKNCPKDMPPIESLGTIRRMAPVSVTQTPYDGEVFMKDRFLVLFERDLLLLSVSREMTSFTFEEWLPLRSITLPRVQPANHDGKVLDILVTQSIRNGDFQKSWSGGNNKFSFLCPSEEDVSLWIEEMRDARRACDSVYARYSVVPSCPQKDVISQIQPIQQNQRISFSSGGSGDIISDSQALKPPSTPRDKSGDFNNEDFVTTTRVTIGHWSTHSLLPHPTLSLSDIDPKLQKVKTEQMKERDGIQAQPQPAGTEDVSIFQIIESYCSSTAHHQRKFLEPKNVNRQPSSSPPASLSTSRSNETLTEEVRQLRLEVQKLRTEVGHLTDLLVKEREARQRIERVVQRLALSSSMTDSRE